MFTVDLEKEWNAWDCPTQGIWLLVNTGKRGVGLQGKFNRLDSFALSDETRATTLGGCLSAIRVELERQLRDDHPFFAGGVQPGIEVVGQQRRVGHRVQALPRTLEQFNRW